MIKRNNGFLAKDKISHDDEIFDYIKELHEYLWRFTRAVLPFANGNLSDYVDIAIEKLEYETRNKTKLNETK